MRTTVRDCRLATSEGCLPLTPSFGHLDPDALNKVALHFLVATVVKLSGAG